MSVKLLFEGVERFSAQISLNLLVQDTQCSECLKDLKGWLIVVEAVTRRLQKRQEAKETILEEETVRLKINKLI